MKETRAGVEDWINDIIENIINNYKGRKVALWGGHGTSHKIAELLKEFHDIDVDYYIDNNRAKVDNLHVFPKEYFAGKSQEYYIAVPIGYYKSVSDSLREMGYISIKDYYYFCDCIVRAERDYYEDRHGNVVRGVWAGIKIPFCCCNVHIEIGEGAVLSNCTITVGSNMYIKIEKSASLDNCNFRVGNNAHIEIGECTVLNNCSLDIRSNAHIKIGGNTIINNNVMTLHNNSGLTLGSSARIVFGGVMRINEWAQVVIGQGFTCEHNLSIIALKYSSISIGDDCMFSLDVALLSGDGHSIFDINSGENINSTMDKVKKAELSIGNHVWIGIKNTILGNTKIGNGSMTGAASLVKGCFPNNCILAGSPARVIRKNIAWSRENGAEDISLCGQKNINLTQEQEDVKKNS